MNEIQSQSCRLTFIFNQHSHFNFQIQSLFLYFHVNEYDGYEYQYKGFNYRSTYPGKSIDNNKEGVVDKR